MVLVNIFAYIILCTAYLENVTLFYFCDIFVRFHLILLSFGRIIPPALANLKLRWLNSPLILYVITVP